MRQWIAVLLCTMLSACYFVSVPWKSSSDDPGPGNLCVGEPATIGQKITNYSEGSKVGTLRAVYGKSSRCADPRWPLLADVEFEPGKRNVQVWEQK